MKTSNLRKNEISNSIYRSVTVDSGKTSYTFCQVSGHFNYFTVTKNNMPFGLVGKDFTSFEAAQKAYKSPLVKTMMLIASVELNNI